MFFGYRKAIVSGLSVLEKRLARETRYRLTYIKFDEYLALCSTEDLLLIDCREEEGEEGGERGGGVWLQR